MWIAAQRKPDHQRLKSVWTLNALAVRRDESRGKDVMEIR